MGNLVYTLMEMGNFESLTRAIRTTGLEETLSGEGPFTLFAPTDEAFAKLPQNTLDNLFNDKPRLKAVITYHVIPEKLMVDDIKNFRILETMQGQLVEVDPHTWHLHLNPKINGVSMIRKDVGADNGVIHVMDSVIMPDLDLTCPTCGRGFLNPEDLDSHLRTAHIPEPIVEEAPAAIFVPAAAAAEPIMSTPVTEVAEVAEPISEPVAARKLRTPTFEVHLDKSNRHRFHLKAPNGEIIGESQAFQTAELAHKDIDLVKKYAPIAKITCVTPTAETAGVEMQEGGAVFEEFSDVNGKWRFRLKEPDGLIILASQAYQSVASCNNGIESVKRNATIAKTIYPKPKEELLTH